LLARISSSERLGLWVGLPFLGLLVLIAATMTLPTPDCEGGGTHTGFADVLVAVIATATSIAAIAAAALQLGRIAALGLDPTDRALSALVAVIVVALALTLGSGNANGVGRFMFYASFFAVVAFPLLGAMALARRRAADARLLTTLYLFGAGLGLYPLFALFVLGASHGAFC
jgi:hypothetical protein